MQAAIMAEDEAGRRASLAELLPLQQADFEGMFEAMRALEEATRRSGPAASASSSSLRTGPARR